MNPGTQVTAEINNLAGKSVIEIHPSKELENSPESFARLLLAISHLRGQSLIDRLTGKTLENITFEIAVFNSTIHFYAIVPNRMHTYIESQILAAYPQAKTTKLETDYLNPASLSGAIFKELALTDAFYFPLRTFQDDKNTDPLSAVLGALSKMAPADIVVFQLNLAHGGSWQSTGRGVIQRGVPDVPDINGKMRYKSHPHAKLIESKISQKGFDVGMRLLSFSKDPGTAQNNLENMASSFGSFSLGEGNNIRIRKDSMFFKTDQKTAFFKRNIEPHPSHQYLNVNEIATMFHLPDDTTGLIKNIAWGGENFTEPPENLPVSTIEMTDEEKQGINFFGKTVFKNVPSTFGIKDGEDRRRHFYIIGKTGTGKSTLIANMAISDIRKGHGVAIIDPHGDLSETLLNYIPSERINDVAYLDPSSSERSFRLNPFEVNDLDQADIIASGIVSIFQKLYSYSWGPRLEYILRNAVLTLVKKSNSTLLDVPRLLTDKTFRQAAVSTLQDPVLKNFWTKEYDMFSETFRQEAISPILNKVGQFLSSSKIRNVVGFEKSTINLDDVMNQGKVMILNLSQGKLGEDNSALLGAFFITKFQLAAMQRVNMPESERKDFYLYVDEFQNFATTSFIKILSEARKYHLNLILANQYMAQLQEEVQKAIFGNVGSTTTFNVGAGDARILFNEFGKVIAEEQLVSLAKYQIALKLSVDGATSTPFLANTLPLLSAINSNREKVLRSSSERFTRPIVPIEMAPPVVATPPPPSAQLPPKPKPFVSPSPPKPSVSPNQFRPPMNQPQTHQQPKPMPNQAKPNPTPIQPSQSPVHSSPSVPPASPAPFTPPAPATNSPRTRTELT